MCGKLRSVAAPPKLERMLEILASCLSEQTRVLPELSIWITASKWANWRAASYRTEDLNEPINKYLKNTNYRLGFIFLHLVFKRLHFTDGETAVLERLSGTPQFEYKN